MSDACPNIGPRCPLECGAIERNIRKRLPLPIGEKGLNPREYGANSSQVYLGTWTLGRETNNLAAILAPTDCTGVELEGRPVEVDGRIIGATAVWLCCKEAAMMSEPPTADMNPVELLDNQVTVMEA